MKLCSRAFVTVLCAVCVAASSTTGCSKPIDPQSSVPAIYQPLIFLAAAVGVGILITSHNHKNQGGGGGPAPPSLTPPLFVGSFANQAFDIALDFSTAGAGGVGGLGRSGGGGNYGFAEIPASVTSTSGSYTLPNGYRPTAVAIDGNGDDWFVDAGGAVKKCPPPSPSVTACVPTLSFSDGLPSAGVRSLAADSGRVFIAQDNLAGMVSWAAFALDGTGRVSSSYTYTPGLGMYNADAVMGTIGSSGLYTVFHKDGASWKITVPSTSKNTFTFSPPPLPNGNMGSDGLGNNYGLLGSPASGSYQLGPYVSAGNSTAAPGTLVSTITIAFNAQTSPNGPPFTPPVSSIHIDDVFIYVVDSAGNLVLFRMF